MRDRDGVNQVEDESSLIQRARDGDEDAYSELFSRHHRAALNYARAIAGANEADDLVAEAFAKLLSALQRDLGPATAFRPYLLTSIRRLWANTLRSRARYDVVEDIAGAADRVHARTAPAEEDSLQEEAIAAAFRQLPERWREVLWLGNVDGYSQAEIARQLDISPNAVAALSFRAREGLRREYLAQHLAATSDPVCQAALPLLPAYVRGTLDRKKVDRAGRHLETCASCTAAVSNLRTISDNLAVALPAVAAGGWLFGEHVAGQTTVPPRPDVGGGGTFWAARRVTAGVTAAGVATIVTVVVWPSGVGPTKVPATPRRTPIVQITDLGLALPPRRRPPPVPAASAPPRLPQAPATISPGTPAPAEPVPPVGVQGTTVTGTADGRSPAPVRASVP